MKTLLVKNGTLVTMNPQREIFRGDILVKGQHIEMVAPSIDQAADQVIDAQGCAVIPGLIQSHIHLTQRLFQGLADDLQLLDWLKNRIWPLEAAHTFETNYLSAQLGIAELISGGTTSIIDMGTVQHTEAIFQALEETGFRALAGKCMMDHGNGVPAGLLEDADASLAESERLATKWHGAAEGRIEYAFAPRFVVSCSENLLVRLQDMARHMGLKVHTHASENQQEIALVEAERGMRNVAYLKKLGLTGENLILAHCIWLDEEEKQILADSGTMIAHCPSSNLKLASGIAPVPELLEMGCHVSLAADGSPCSNNLDMFTEMRHAALIQKTRLFDSTTMPAATVFELATLGGARAMGKEGQLGSLEVGKLADLAIVQLDTLHNSPCFGRNVVAQLVYSVRAADVLTTIVNGQILMQDRQLLTIDRGALIAEVERVSPQVVATIRS
jgi:5-methylthioadenosine/S-adenosylhomocysteine deaminase|nr:5'-deoxyadenosine deaminase [Candidatus Krumholzibacteria bacterium]